VPVGVVEINNLERVKLYYIFLKTMNLTVNQRVAGSSPAGGATNPASDGGVFC